MSTTYTWKIDYMDTKPQQDGFENVVVGCRWSVSGTDGIGTGSNFGYTKFEQDQSGDFTAYEDLTESQVLAWVWSASSENGGVVQADVEAAIEADLEAARTPPTVILGNPWIPALPPTPPAP